MELTPLIAGAAALGAVVVLAVVAGIAIARSRARSRRARAERQLAAGQRSAELERTAGGALVRLDERVRLADDEVGFVVAEFGDDGAAGFRSALDRARQRLSEAFQVNQQLHDHLPETPEQRVALAERVLALCRSAEEGLAEQAAAIAARRSTARRTPSEVDRVRADIERVRQLVPDARNSLEALRGRYAESALLPVASNADQAEQLLGFAARGLDVAGSRVRAARDSEADAAVRASAEAVRQSEHLLAAVDSFEVEALRAETTLAAMVAESRAELSAARGLTVGPGSERVATAAAALEGALAELPPPGAPVDPVASLTVIRQANAALDAAVAEVGESADRRERLRAQLETAIDDAERQIAAAENLVADYRGSIGPDARTRLAEAQREFADLTLEREPESAIARARRAAALAAEATALAHADLQDPGYGPGGMHPLSGYGRGPAMIGGVLGGLAIGGLFEGLGDVGDLFD